MLVHKAARLLEENCGSGQSVGELAAKLGCTDQMCIRDSFYIENTGFIAAKTACALHAGKKERYGYSLSQ